MSNINYAQAATTAINQNNNLRRFFASGADNYFVFFREGVPDDIDLPPCSSTGTITQEEPQDVPAFYYEGYQTPEEAQAAAEAFRRVSPHIASPAYQINRDDGHMTFQEITTSVALER